MALTATQKAEVRRSLGWPARFFQYDTRLEQAMSAIETQPEHEAQVIEILASVVDVKEKLLDAHKRLKASKVGSIELDTLREETMGLRMEGRRFTGELSAILGVPRKHDIFSSGSFGGFVGPYGTYKSYF